jgi:hypothetical protein
MTPKEKNRYSRPAMDGWVKERFRIQDKTNGILIKEQNKIRTAARVVTAVLVVWLTALTVRQR